MKRPLHGTALADYSERIRVDLENPDSLLHRVLMLSTCKHDRIRDGKHPFADATKAWEIFGMVQLAVFTGLGVRLRRDRQFRCGNQMV